MKLHLGLPGDTPLFTAYGEGYIDIAGKRFTGNVALCQGEVREQWTSHDFAGLEEADLAHIAESDIDIALLGTGTKLRFPPSQLMRPFAGTRVGLEVMDTNAACRTYNILIAEGRKVGAFLLLG